MSSRRYIVVSGMVFGLIALGQLLRAANQVPVQAGGVAVPVWASWLAFLAAAIMSTWAFAARK